MMTDAELQHMLVLDDGPGPAHAIDAARADALVAAALAGAGLGPSGGGSAGAAAKTTAGGMKLAIVAGIVVAVFVIALLVGRARRGADTLPADAPIPDSAGATTASAPAMPEPPPPAADAAVEDEITIDPVPAPPTAEPPTRAKPARKEPSASDAADLLGEANAKRAAKKWRESDALYARVVERAPKSLAAQTALVASASLHLEHLGDPKGAAQRFRRALALAPAGALAEDARWGLAEAARANHDSKAEAAALDEFLAHHGTSPLADRARARRAELR